MRSPAWLAWLGVLLAAVAACADIARYRDLRYEASTVCVSVVLPSTGEGRVRLVNVGTSDSTTDFCLRPSGTSDWGAPVFTNATAACDTGLSYATSTVPFAVAAGMIDVEAVPAGQACSATATSELDGVAVGDGTQGAPVMTLVRYGGGSAPEAISALPEAITVAPGNATQLRVVNALADTRSIEWGFSTSQTLPATVTSPIVTVPIAPGDATPSSATSSAATFDASGYATFLAAAFNVAAYYANDAARTAITLEVVNGGLGTFYVIGDAEDAQNRHPVTGLYCLDDVSLAASAMDAGTADGAPTTQRALLADCATAPLPLFSVDLLSVGLYAVIAPFEDARRPYIYRDIAARPSDFMCIVEAGSIEDRTAIANAAKVTTAQGTAGRFPYSFMITTDESTPPSNPADVLPPLASPPCGLGVVDQSQVAQVYSCAEQYCSTVPGGDPNGQGSLYGTTNCLTSSCAAAFLPFFSPITAQTTPQDLANDYCFDCMVWSVLSDDTYATGKTKCTDQPLRPFIFTGQTPIMMLSHYPIAATSVYELPSTGYSRAILKAQITVENDQTIDFFCGALAYPQVDPQLPYTGAYGSDVAPDGGRANGYEDEQDLQAREALAWMKQQIAADGLPAIIAIDLESTDATGAPADAGLVSMSPEVVDLFDSSGLTPNVVPNAPPFCDQCPSPKNPYNGPVNGEEWYHSFLSGFPANATRTETLWGNDDSEVPIPANVPGQPAPPGGTGPILQYFAHNYTILRPSP